MAKKYFLGSVGTVEALRYDAVNGKWVVAFRSKTLTDSGINISTTKDDIRAGTGAPIQFSFYHDPSVEINLTDVVFDQAYVEAQLGTQFVTGGKAYFTQEVSKSEGTSISLTHTAQSLTGSCSDDVVIWLSEKGKNEWMSAEDAKTAGIISAYTESTVTLASAGDYCLRYLYIDSNAQIAEITSEIIPQELYLVISAPVYSGDACSASAGKKAGTITYEIPRFKLNGAQDFSMNMSSNQTMSLSGVALASEDDCDVSGSNLVRIIVQYDGLHWYDDTIDLIADEDSLVEGVEPKIYALHKNSSVSLIPNSDLTFSPALAGGKFSAEGSVEVTVTAKPTLTDTFTVAAA